MEKDSERRFARGVTVLAAAGIICKIIGAIYRIPLANIIGAEAMGIYSKAYLLYAFLWLASTSGLPGAISGSVAGRLAAGDEAGAMSVFAAARRVLLAAGAAFTAVMILASPLVTGALGITGGELAIICIAPSLLLTVASAYMGYFQGRRQMLPTAVTQLTGSIGKLAAGIALAAAWKDKGAVWAASGALLGVTVSELLSVVLIHFIYLKYRKTHKVRADKQPGIIRELLLKAIPITVCGAAVPLLNMLDALLITFCLSLKGMDESSINSAYGVLSGMVSPIINVPGAVAISLSAVLLPSVSALFAVKNTAAAGVTAGRGLRLGIMISAPAALGIFLVSAPLVSALYPVGEISLLQQQLGIRLLRLLSPAVLGIGIMYPLAGVLQGAGHPYLPALSIGVGALIKLVAGALLMSTGLDIAGAPIASCLCFFAAAGMNICFAVKYCGLSLPVGDVLKILLSCGIMGGLLFGALCLLPGGTMTAVVCIAGAIVVYFSVLLLIGGIKNEDFELIPGGNALKKLLIKIKLLRA